MKTLFKLLVIIILTTASIATTKVARSQVSASISFSVFHDGLQPYGRWIHHSRYGEAWIPRVSGFRPYSTGGHWAYTDYGWTWVSDYDWGWAPFHYGRWAYDPAYGWIWVPGYEWGPAWVSWRSDNDYYGWAPLTPDVNIGIGVSFGSSIPVDFWVFAPVRYITSPVIYRYYVPRTRNVTIIKRTTIINNTREANFSNQRIVVVGGPKRENVERVTRSKVTVMHVNESTKPGRETVDRSKNTINVYRPVINKTTVNKTVVNNKEVNKTTVNNNKTVDNKKEVNKSTTNNNKTINNNKEVNKSTTNKNTTENKNTNKTVNKNQQTEKKPGTENNQNNTKQHKPAPSKKPNQSKPNNDNNKPNNDNTKPNNDNNKPDNPKNNNNDNDNNDKDKKPQAQITHSKAVQIAQQHKNDIKRNSQAQKQQQKNQKDNDKNDVAKSNNKHKPNNQ